MLNEEFSNYDEVFLKRAFWKRDLDLLYDSSEGRYVVSARDHKTLREDEGDEEVARNDDETHRMEMDRVLEELGPERFQGLVVQLIVFAGTEVKWEKRVQSTAATTGLSLNLLLYICCKWLPF